jgi:hypothetical protein
MGGLRYTDKKRVNYFIKKGNADTFYEQLKLLNEGEIIIKWERKLKNKGNAVY